MKTTTKFLGDAVSSKLMNEVMAADREGNVAALKKSTQKPSKQKRRVVKRKSSSMKAKISSLVVKEDVNYKNCFHEFERSFTT